jgi:segregation and condensation protein A
VPAVNSFAVESALYQGYQLRLPAFEGPFDVLLRLVERSHLAITDVSLVAVTAQFLNYVGSMDHANAELIAEFSSVGSRLIVLKSRSLLPRPPVEDAESVSDLARELIEYLAVKETAQLLGERDVQGAGAFPIAGAPAPAHDRSVLRPLPALIVAARKLVSLRDMAERVLSGLHHSGSSTFRSITAACVDLHETRTAFLAVLILARRQIVEVEQTELFGEINIRSGSSLRGTDSFLNSLSFED